MAIVLYSIFLKNVQNPFSLSVSQSSQGFVAMFTRMILPASLVIALSAVASLATPLDLSRELVPRDNAWKLHCSNAPNVTAGE